MGDLVKGNIPKIRAEYSGSMTLDDFEWLKRHSCRNKISEPFMNLQIAYADNTSQIENFKATNRHI